ncbi:hypothetical protein JXM67_12095 [candidate division WOR-3 bacterium]|nr:hypothetical protein [candidate division WOR-3 bacterium]
MIKKILVIVAGLVLLFTACSKEEVPVVAKYWPFAAGNEWKTAEAFTWAISGPISNSGSSSSTTEYSVDSLESFKDGKQVWPVTHTTYTEGVDPVVVTEYYHVTEDSIFIYPAKDTAQPSMVEPNNLEVGMDWDGRLGIPMTIPDLPGFSTEFPAHFKVVSTESVTVPAGTYTSLRIQIDLEPSAGNTIDSAAIQWRVENMGIVKMTVDFTTVYPTAIGNLNVDIKGTSEMTERNWQ